MNKSIIIQISQIALLIGVLWFYGAGMYEFGQSVPNGLRLCHTTNLEAGQRVELSEEGILRKVAQDHHFDFQMLYDLWRCEAQWKHDGEWGDEYQSYGAFQWQIVSWVRYNEMFGTELNILSFEDQAILTVLTLKTEGGWENWFNCLKKYH